MHSQMHARLDSAGDGLSSLTGLTLSLWLLPGSRSQHHVRRQVYITIIRILDAIGDTKGIIWGERSVSASTPVFGSG